MEMNASDYLTENALGLLNDPVDAGELRAEYGKLGVIQIPDFLLAEKAASLGERLYEIFHPFTARSEKLARVLHVDGKSILGSSFRFSRVDPNFPEIDERQRGVLMERFAEVGLERFGGELGRMATPLVRYLTGNEELSYQKIYVFLYEEGDYIGPHTDAHLGDRVNLQFPVPLGAATGFRALHEGRFHLYEDTLGSARILGPDVWHEVLPVLRTNSEVRPRRVLISLRYT